MNALSRIRNRLPASTVLLVGSTVCALLTILGSIALLFGLPGRGDWIGWSGNPAYLLLGIVALLGGVILFGWILAPGWRGQSSAIGGCLAGILTYVAGMGGALVVLQSIASYDTWWPALFGSIIAATALLLSQTQSRRGMIGISVGLVVSIVLVQALVALKVLSAEVEIGAFIWGWVSVSFFWLVLVGRARWWDGVIWLLIIALSLLMKRLLSFE